MGPPKPPVEKAASAGVHMTKKCPECFTYLPLDAGRCHACGSRVGPVDKLGHARKVANVRAYIVAVFFAAVVAGVLWLGFFTE